MSSITRSMQRNIIRQQCRERDGNIKGFRAKWYKFHYGKKKIVDKDGNTISINKRQNRSLINRQLRRFKNVVTKNILADAKNRQKKNIEDNN